MYKALIAEDEPLLAESLKRELSRAWPELTVASVVGDGERAVSQSMDLMPDVVFFDIQMPVMTGLEAASGLLCAWGESASTARKALPLIVFVTAYDEYALAAFDAQAADYILKPVRPDRLTQTITRLKARLANRASSMQDFDETASQLRALLLAANPPQEKLGVIQASRQTSGGSAIHLIPIEEVVYFEAADKYIRVLTEGQEYLIRTPLKELIAQLDKNVFWQVHRGTVVQVSSIASVHRDESFKVSIKLRNRPETLSVSRLYGHLFKAM
jgi:DNA-binding LytR/AlgR family response regulator